MGRAAGAEGKVPVAGASSTGANGFAIVWGLYHSKGDAVVIMMADSFDSAADAVTCWRILNRGCACAFGSSFVAGGAVYDYHRVKLFVNRFANFLVRVCFNIPFNDTTNAFKAYRRIIIDGCRPLPSPALQSHRRNLAEGDRARLYFRH